ncbi:hypothetical protein LUZ60_005230 [Juncus effusus]|nr:hypothetical protein LUZ60_005230 [Juncus effusus]
MSSSWSDLPPDLLTAILSRLPLPDRFRFSSVCSSWLSASISSPFSPSSPQSPWLLLPHNPMVCPSSVSRFFSVCENKTYKIEQKEGPVSISDCLCIGSSNGWLIVADLCSELHLINPITGSQIDLPSVVSFPFVDAIRDDEGLVSEYIVRICEELPPETFAPDKLRWRGMANVKYKWEPRPEYVEYTTTKVLIFEWKKGTKNWVEIKEQIEDFAPFLGQNTSFCVNLHDCPEIRGNCIYFTDDRIWSYEKCHEVFPDAGIFDLREMSYEPCCAYDLVWKWPPPIWISPSLS